MRTKQTRKNYYLYKENKTYCWLKDTPYFASLEDIDLTSLHKSGPLITQTPSR